MQRAFNVEITFKDLCAFAPRKVQGRPEGMFLLPEVRRPKHWRRIGDSPIHPNDDEPFHAHLPVVVIEEDDLLPHHQVERLTYIKHVGRRFNHKRGEWLWFPSDADLLIKTHRDKEQRAFRDEVNRQEVCDFSWIYGEGQKPQLDPLLLRPLEELNKHELQSLREKLHLRVILDDGRLTNATPEQEETWILKAPGDSDVVEKGRPLADAMVLHLQHVEGLTLGTQPFEGNRELLELKPSGETLRLTIMNMTVEMYLGLNFGDHAFWEREINRAKHFKLFFDLAKTWSNPRKIPYRAKPRIFDPTMPPEELFCPPLYFGG